MTDPLKALILEDGNQRGVLAAARALGAAGWEVGVGSPHRGLTSRSRWTSRWHAVPSPTAGLGPFVESIGRARDIGRYDVAFGGGDAEVLALSACRHRLDLTVPLPTHEVVLSAFDKTALAGAAAAAGLILPRTYEGPDELTADSVVVKERLHGDPAAGTAAHHRPPVVVPVDEAARWCAEIRAAGGAPFLQEVVDGELLALVVVVDRDGSVVATGQQRSSRLWPPVAGVSARARSLPVDPDLLARTAALLADLGWYGLAQLQFIAPPDGQPRLIDFNGRFFGSLQLAVAAGLDLPGALASLVTGEPLRRQAPMRAGVRYQWLEGDLRRAFEERRGGLARDVVDCLRFAQGATHSTWHLTDPGPVVGLSLDLLARGAGKVLGRAPTTVPRITASNSFALEAVEPRFRRCWEDAAEAMATTPFGHPAWLLAWWQAFGAGELHVAVLRRRGEVVALLPLSRRRCTLWAPTNSETPLFEPLFADEDAAAELGAELLHRHRGRVVLGPLEPVAPGTQGLLTAARTAGGRHLARPALCSPHLVPAATWAEFAAALPSGRRQDLRRRRRRLEEALGPVLLEVSNGTEHLEADLDEGLRLEASGWKGKAGTAIDARSPTARFYRALAREAARCGWLRLAFLRAGDRRVAFDYSLEHDGVHYLLKTGFDEELRRFGPGMLLREAMVRRAHEEHLHSYELLGNDDPWKRDWSTGVRERVSLTFVARTAAGRATWAAETYGRPLARWALQGTVRRRR